jgi:hypothetical protein
VPYGLVGCSPDPEARLHAEVDATLGEVPARRFLVDEREGKLLGAAALCAHNSFGSIAL